MAGSFKVSVTPGLISSMAREPHSSAAGEAPAKEDPSFQRGFQEAERQYRQHLVKQQEEFNMELYKKEVGPR
jgi:hypothetical protein